MNSSSSGAGTNHTLTPSTLSSTYSYITGKRSHITQSSITTSSSELRELTNTLQELNNHFKRNMKLLTEMKDQFVKVCEKQEARLVDDNAVIHKLENVCIKFFNLFHLKQSKDNVLYTKGEYLCRKKLIFIFKCV